MNDHGDGLIAIGLVLAFIGGALGSRLLAAYRFMNSAKAGAKSAAGVDRSLSGPPLRLGEAGRPHPGNRFWRRADISSGRGQFGAWINSTC
jgi:hypothetical protein